MSTEIAIFMTVAQTDTCFFLYHLSRIYLVQHMDHSLEQCSRLFYKLKGPIWFLCSWHVPILRFYTHMLNKLTWGTSIRDLFRDFQTPDKMVATAMKGVKVANW